MPELDVFVAINSGTNDMQAIMNLVWDHLLPAFQGEALPDSEEDNLALKNRLSGLSLSTIEGEKISSRAEIISGKHYILESNILELKSFLFEFSETVNSITFTSEKESIVLPVGYGSTESGIMLFPQYGKQPVATTGAWISESTYRARLYYYETPFFLTLDFIFADNVLTMDGEMNVGSGSRDILQLKGIVE
jgi:hypothetical protein